MIRLAPAPDEQSASSDHLISIPAPFLENFLLVLPHSAGWSLRSSQNTQEAMLWSDGQQQCCTSPCMSHLAAGDEPGWQLRRQCSGIQVATAKLLKLPCHLTCSHALQEAEEAAMPRPDGQPHFPLPTCLFCWTKSDGPCGKLRAV